MLRRIIQDKIFKSKKSVLLVGPRQTGKSTLIRALNPEVGFNLMQESLFLDFASNPNFLTEFVKAQHPKTIFVDEVQRLPSLLNTIQFIIDESPNPPKFYLTGSSARKLRRGNANLLPGRIHSYEMGPICIGEFKEISSKSLLSHGSLPGIVTEPDVESREKLLLSYTGTYLKEEIQAEALTKNLEGFSRFLLVAAAECSRFLDLSKLAAQAQISRHAAIRWFEILEDTLLVSRVDSYKSTARKRLVQHPRFFFFDNGIINSLLRNFVASSDRIGMLFENLMHSQIKSTAQAHDLQVAIYNYRTEHGAEIDFVVEFPNGDLWTIECKATTSLGKTSHNGFSSFDSTFGPRSRHTIAYLGTVRRRLESGAELWPWHELIEEMFLKF